MFSDGNLLKKWYYLVVAIGFPIMLLIAIFVASQVMGGRTWDEELDYVGVHSQLDVASRLLQGDWSAHFSQVPRNFAFYGIVAVIPAYIAEQIAVHFGLSDLLSVYSRTLHATAFLCYGLTLLVTYAILVRTTSSRLAALCGTVLLALFPLWLGFSFFDHKDVPTALFSTLALYAAIGLLQSEGRARDIRVFTSVLVAATVLMAGLKLPALALVVPSWCAAFYVYVGRKKLKMAAALVVATSIGVALVTPVAWSDPFNFVMQSLLAMSRHSWGGCTISAGTWMCPHGADWSATKYMFTWYTAQIPVLVGVGALLAVVMSIWKGRVQVLISVTLVLPLLLISLRNSTLYDGLRHLLFTLPLIFILATMFWYEIGRRAGFAPILVMSGILAGLFTWDNIAMFPYNYVYFNLPTRALADDGNFVTDLWGYSLKEAAQLPVVDSQPGLPVIAYPSHLVIPFLLKDHPQVVDPGQISSLPHPGEAVMISYVRDQPVPKWCRDPQFVSRHLPMGREIRMSYVARCSLR